MNCFECTDEDKRVRGCEGGVDWQIGKLVVDRCPENFMNECSSYIDMWQDWKKFGYPYPGHWTEQPHFVIDTIRILENEMNAINEERRNK